MNQKFQKALDCYNKALELYPECAPIWHQIGVCHAGLGEFQEAIKAIDKALEIAHNVPATLRGKGSRAILKEMGKYDEALRSLNRALDIDPLDEASWNVLRDLAIEKWGGHEGIAYISELRELKFSKHR